MLGIEWLLSVLSFIYTYVCMYMYLCSAGHTVCRQEKLVCVCVCLWSD